MVPAETLPLSWPDGVAPPVGVVPVGAPVGALVGWVMSADGVLAWSVASKVPLVGASVATEVAPPVALPGAGVVASLLASCVVPWSLVEPLPAVLEAPPAPRPTWLKAWAGWPARALSM